MTLIHPSTLSNSELARFAEDILYKEGSLPLEWQKEIVARLSNRS